MMATETLTTTTTAVTKAGERVVFPYSSGQPAGSYQSSGAVLKVGGTPLPITFSASFGDAGAVVSLGAGAEIPAGTLSLDVIYAAIVEPIEFRSATSQHPGLYNFKPSNLKKWRQAVATVRAGVGRGKILTIGDSTTFGVGAGTQAGLRAQSYPSRLAEILAGTGLNATKSSFFGTGAISTATYNTYNPQVVLGAGWSGSSFSLGGQQFTNSTTTNALAFTPDMSVDTFILFHGQNTGLGTFTYAVDAGGTTSVNTANAAAGVIRTVISAGSLGAHTLNLARVSGSVFIIGAYAYDSTKAGVDVLNAGWGGSTTVDWTDSSSQLRARYTIGVAQPDLILINLGINDYTPAYGPTAVATYKSNLLTLVNDNRASSDIVLIAPIPSDATRQALDVQAQYIRALYEVAAEKDLPLIDMVQRWGSYVESSFYYWPGDIVHGNNLGYADEAQIVAKALAI